MENQSVLISGASGAGPALAYWLSCYGVQSTVVERASAPRDGGYAIDFRGVSVDALDRMGLLADVQRAQTNMGAVSFVNDAGRRLASLPAAFMSGEVEILRGDLTLILYAATKDTTRYVFDDSITNLAQQCDGAHVTFERGASAVFDLVVGADGLHSNVRALAFGDESRFIRHLGYYVAIFTVANHLNLDHTGLYYNIPGKLAGIYSARQNTEAKVFLCFASPPLPYDRHDIERQKTIVAETYAGVGWEVPRLLDAMQQADDFYFDSVSQIHIDSWSSGRVALVGDAGYCASPLSGMGTGLAVVGAYVLAGELKAAGGDYHAAFAHYEHAMRNYVARCQKIALGADKGFVPRTRRGIWLRNQAMRGIPYLPWKGVFTADLRKAANAITLKEYGD